MPVSLWSNQGKSGEYRDKTFYESDNIIIIKYFGQRKGGRDHLITEGAYFFIKDEKLEKPNMYTFKGKVKLVSKLPKEEGINVYELVICKEEPVQFRIKKDAYSHFKWNTEDVMSGIIKH
jgi:hypothetical protein